MNDNNILAVILAGGKSKRFGEDKNLAKLGSISLIEHTIYKIREKFKKILIIANNDLKVEEFKDIVPRSKRKQNCKISLRLKDPAIALLRPDIAKFNLWNFFIHFEIIVAAVAIKIIDKTNPKTNNV